MTTRITLEEATAFDPNDYNLQDVPQSDPTDDAKLLFGVARLDGDEILEPSDFTLITETHESLSIDRVRHLIEMTPKITTELHTFNPGWKYTFVKSQIHNKIGAESDSFMVGQGEDTVSFSTLVAASALSFMTHVPLLEYGTYLDKIKILFNQPKAREMTLSRFIATLTTMSVAYDAKFLPSSKFYSAFPNLKNDLDFLMDEITTMNLLVGYDGSLASQNSNGRFIGKSTDGHIEGKLLLNHLTKDPRSTIIHELNHAVMKVLTPRTTRLESELTAHELELAYQMTLEGENNVISKLEQREAADHTKRKATLSKLQEEATQYSVKGSDTTRRLSAFYRQIPAIIENNNLPPLADLSAARMAKSVLNGESPEQIETRKDEFRKSYAHTLPYQIGLAIFQMIDKEVSSRTKKGQMVFVAVTLMAMNRDETIEKMLATLPEEILKDHREFYYKTLDAFLRAYEAVVGSDDFAEGMRIILEEAKPLIQAEATQVLNSPPI